MARWKVHKAAVGLAAIASANAAASAQDGTAEPDSQTGADSPTEARGIPMIIVTARKQEESLQDAPLSMTVFTSEAIERAGITDIDDVALRTPGLVYGDFGDEKLSPLSLRGIVGGSGSAGADPAVGIYLDEVFLGQGVGATIDLFDLDRIEVLRGPQGTLFGRNTIGGLIHYVPARPTKEFEASFNAEYGNYDYLRFGGAASGPLVGDSVLARVAFVRNHRDGTERNLVLDRDVNSQGSWSVRGQLQFNIGNNTEWRLSADYRKVDQDSLVFETLRYNENTTFVFLLDSVGGQRNTDPFDRKVFADDVTYERSDALGFASHFTTEIGGVQLVNITAYREHDYENRTDTDRSVLQIGYDGDPEEVWRFSNEFRLSGSAGPVDLIGGAYYYHQDTTNESFIELGPDLLGLFGIPGSLTIGSNADMKTTSWAVFGSGTWNISDSIDVTLGGRYTDEHKSIDYTQSDLLGLIGGDFAVVADNDWAEFTPSANVRVHFTPDIMAYATVSRGFKSGGFNDSLGDANGISFGPETLWNYEAGLKASLFDNLVQANLSTFYMKWSDIQISVDNPNTPVFDPIILNAGAAHSTGVELEIIAQPTENLTIGFNGTLLEAEYDEGALPDGTPLDVIPRAPSYTANFNGEYRLPVSSSTHVFLGGELLLRGRSYLTPDNQADGRVDAYALVNLSAGLEARDGSWRLSVWGRNIGDTVVKERLFDLFDQDTVGQKFIVLNDPATYGASFSVRF